MARYLAWCWVILLSGGALWWHSASFWRPAQALHLVMTAALVASGLLVLLLIIGTELAVPWRRDDLA